MTVATERRVRVWVTPVWDAVELRVTPEWTVERLKREALRVAMGRAADPAAYTVKYRGGPLLDESRTLSDLGVPDGAPFIVLPTRRQPVR